jgi:dihydrofolate synthase/folylpolyglutamate synthase
MLSHKAPPETAGRGRDTSQPALLLWLERCERLHPTTIEMGLDRVEQVRARLDLKFSCAVVTVAGTNGKGSTCAMLESIALQAGYRVGVYTSPHLVRFEERCRIEGVAVDAQQLVPHFEAVEAARGAVSLTYFEFTSLAIMRLLSQAPLDLAVLEVGLGGRLDAVNIVDTDCAVITSIDIDHTAYLGSGREAIGFEKAGIMRAGRPVIVSDPAPPDSVLSHAAAIGADLRCIGRDFNYGAQQGASGAWQQWSWAGRGKRYNGLAYPALRGANQLLNASGVLAAFEALHERLPISAQAVRNGLALVDLPGRVQIVPGQPTLVLDVAHNPHAVAALASNLDRMGFYPRTAAVFGAMRDKDIAGMLARLAPMVDDWHVCDLPTARAATAAELEEQLSALSLRGPASRVTRHADPMSALRVAVAHADPADRIVVFGSFYTVGGVLKDGLPRITTARHIG